MKQLATIVVLATLSLNLQVAAAQGMKDMPMKNASSATATHKGTGMVMKADAERRMVTLAHEPIASMKWKAMTMEFEVADKKMLENLKPGAKVEFDFKEKSKGKYIITEIKR